MKLICNAKNFGINTVTRGVLNIINNQTDIKNFKKGNIALFNVNFLTIDSLNIISNLINNGAIGFISFNNTKSDHGCIAAKEMGMNFYNISDKQKKIMSYDNKIITLKDNKIYYGKVKKNKISNEFIKKITIKHKVKVNLGFPSLIQKNKKFVNYSDSVGFCRMDFLLSQIPNNVHPAKYIEINGLDKLSTQIANHLRPAVKLLSEKKLEYWIRTDDFSVEQLINMRFGKDYEMYEKNSSTGLRGIRRSIKIRDFIIHRKCI